MRTTWSQVELTNYIFVFDTDRDKTLKHILCVILFEVLKPVQIHLLFLRTACHTYDYITIIFMRFLAFEYFKTVFGMVEYNVVAGLCMLIR